MEREETITQILTREARRRNDWVQPPEVSHLPFMGSRDDEFLLVSLLLRSEIIDRVEIANECITVARLVVGSSLLTNEKAVEVSAYSLNGKKVRRISRLIIFSQAFELAMRIDVAEVLNNQSEGIRCQWPLHPLP